MVYHLEIKREIEIAPSTVIGLENVTSVIQTVFKRDLSDTEADSLYDDLPTYPIQLTGLELTAKLENCGHIKDLIKNKSDTHFVSFINRKGK